MDGGRRRPGTRRASAGRSWAGPQRTWRRAPETGSPSTAEDEGGRRLLGPPRAAPPAPGLRRRAARDTGARWPQPGGQPRPMTQHTTPRRDGARPSQKPRRPRPQPGCPVPRLRLHRRQVSRSPRVARRGGRYSSTARPHAGPPSRSPAPGAANARHARTRARHFRGFGASRKDAGFRRNPLWVEMAWIPAAAKPKGEGKETASTLIPGH